MGPWVGRGFIKGFWEKHSQYVKRLWWRWQRGFTPVHLKHTCTQGSIWLLKGLLSELPSLVLWTYQGNCSMEGLFSSFLPWLWSQGMCWPTPVPCGLPPSTETPVHVWVRQKKKEMVWAEHNHAEVFPQICSEGLAWNSHDRVRRSMVMSKRICRAEVVVARARCDNCWGEFPYLQGSWDREDSCRIQGSTCLLKPAVGSAAGGMPWQPLESATVAVLII